MPHGSPPRLSAPSSQLPDAGIRAAAALAGRPGQTASAAARRRGQSAACYCYEGNLLALAQALRLALLWPDGKLTLPRVEQAVNDTAHFTPYHWVDALLAGKSKRVLHVPQQLRLEGCRPAILHVLCSGSCCCWLTSSARRRTRRCARCLMKHRVWQNPPSAAQRRSHA
ncbi:hypothetical protein MJ575_09005 [Klebsiella pneumoniae]|nr:hypothetical protein MJ575_09005 [Klebsiella pneumoniae]